MLKLKKKANKRQKTIALELMKRAQPLAEYNHCRNWDNVPKIINEEGLSSDDVGSSSNGKETSNCSALKEKDITNTVCNYEDKTGGGSASRVSGASGASGASAVSGALEESSKLRKEVDITIKPKPMPQK